MSVDSLRYQTESALVARVEEAPCGPDVVAIFDLDGVLVRGTSGVLFGAALARTRPSALTACAYALLGAGLYGVGRRTPLATYSVIGRLLRGRAVEDVAAIAATVAGRLLSLRGDGALRRLITCHRARAHRVIVASGAPAPIVRSLAGQLGTSLIVASEYTVLAGRFTGELSASPSLGGEKLHRLEHLATQESFRLAHAFAYCNDFADRALLGTVAHPAAINPDEPLALLALAKGWPCWCRADQAR